MSYGTENEEYLDKVYFFESRLRTLNKLEQTSNVRSQKRKLLSEMNSFMFHNFTQPITRFKGSSGKTLLINRMSRTQVLRASGTKPESRDYLKPRIKVFGKY